MTGTDDIGNLVEIKKKRLAILEEKRALLGYNTPAEVLMEIADITAEIENLEREREPFEYERFCMRAQITEVGGATIFREVSLRALGMLDRLEHYLMVSSSYRPDGTTSPLSVSVLRSPSPVRQLVYDATEPEPNNRVVQIRIEPPLHDGNRLEYMLVERVRPGIALPGAADGRGRFSQLSFDVNHSTQQLRLEALLPLQWAPIEAQVEVSRGGARIPIPELTSQLQGWLSTGQREQDGQLYSQYVLDVDAPVRGLTYVLRWAPVVEDLGYR